MSVNNCKTQLMKKISFVFSVSELQFLKGLAMCEVQNVENRCSRTLTHTFHPSAQFLLSSNLYLKAWYGICSILMGLIKIALVYLCVGCT